jgi:putative colanic acid biosysnthesis UDP-glucose lipid carrier transferase
MLYDAEGFHNATETTVSPVAPVLDWSAHFPQRSEGDRTLRGQLALKRMLDVAASIFLLAFFAPLLVVIAIAILGIDRMPVLYRQQRYGRGGVVFTILKFRTMTVAETSAEFVQAAPGDTRITALGAYLRRTSLDELPQLWNVLVGDMSLVGPRPHALAMEEEIIARYPRGARRLTMRPGMTGLAQIRGLRGPTRRRDDVFRRIDADVQYVETWSLGRDAGILAATPAAWVLGKNAC